jgi:hypothetical protein
LVTDWGPAGHAAATHSGTAVHSTSLGKARRAACCRSTVLISATAQDKCRADRRAETDSSFHLFLVRCLAAGRMLPFRLPPINEPAKKQAVIPHFPADRLGDARIMLLPVDLRQIKPETEPATMPTYLGM